MVEILHVLRGGGGSRGHAMATGGIAMSDDTSILTREELATRVAGAAEEFRTLPQMIGLLGGSGTDWAVAALAAWTAGKTVVPLPTFFSLAQLDYVLRDAGVSHVVATSEAIGLAATLAGAYAHFARRAMTFSEPLDGAGVIVYTSGTTGPPKGVRLGLQQIDLQARALAAAIKACPGDLHLSVLPLPCCLRSSLLSACRFLSARARNLPPPSPTASASVARPTCSPTFEQWRPTTTVLVPQLLSAWIAELDASGQRAPESLRFVAVGGAGVPESLAARAWDFGIPVHEGYGLTECCSVVAVNRPGQRRVGTVGVALPGLDIAIERDEVVVRGPTIMAGYLHGSPAPDHGRPAISAARA